MLVVLCLSYIYMIKMTKMAQQSLPLCTMLNIKYVLSNINK